MHSNRAKRWQIREASTDLVELLVKGGISPLIARLLVNRGITSVADATWFLVPVFGSMHDPLKLSGMTRAVTRLAVAIEKGETVCVHGDYDVDGITSTALLIDFFQAIGLACFWYIPNRLLDGYGLSAEGVEVAAAKGATVMVTVDCGITALNEALLCKQKGIDLIITDHHTPGIELPEAFAIINPLQPGCQFPFKSLAGVGVAFNLLVALRGALRERGFFAGRREPDLRAALDLVALGTVADVVQLVDENRLFVSHGLKELSNSPRAGIKALKSVAGISDEVSCGGVGFRLAPRLNACGRLDDASLGVELLLATDQGKADEIAAVLDAGNAERQNIEKGILQEALEMVQRDQGMRDRRSIVLASPDWHPGVIGIVASRLVDLYHRPTILISLADGNGKGSGRSIRAFHLYDALKACGEHLLHFGGHRQAAGLAIAEETLAAFVEHFDEVASGVLTPDDLVPVLSVDGELQPGEISLRLAEDLAVLKPFGMGNPEPLFILKGATVSDCRVIKDIHLKLRIVAGGINFEAIAFGMAGRVGQGELIDLVFSLGLNSWKGKTTLQLDVKDLRPAGDINAEN
jgi:single-stranded-DNA-specific exonuclease